MTPINTTKDDPSSNDEPTSLPKAPTKHVIPSYTWNHDEHFINEVYPWSQQDKITQHQELRKVEYKHNL